MYERNSRYKTIEDPSLDRESDHLQRGQQNDPSPAQSPATDARELKAVHRASQRLQYLMDPAELAQELICVLEETLGYDFGAVLVVDRNSNDLVPFALSDQGYGDTFIEIDKQYVTSCGVRVGKGITGWVAQHGESVLVGDVRHDPRYHGIRSDIRSELCVPMRARGSIIGVVNVETRKQNAYTDSDRQVLEAIAAQMAVAITNAQLYEQTQQTQKMEILGQLTGGIIHDMNGFLTVINGICETILPKLGENHTLFGDIDQIRHAGAQGEALTRQLLAYCRKQDITFEVLNLNHVIGQMEVMLQRLVGRRVTISTNYGRDLRGVKSNAGQIEQIILNLVLNAQQAMPGRGRISIATCNTAAGEIDSRHVSPERPESYVLLSVTDTGPGMDSELQSKIFTPFFTTKERGTGLGLSTVERIVEESGGFIEVDSEIERGTTFKIYLPGQAD